MNFQRSQSSRTGVLLLLFVQTLLLGYLAYVSSPNYDEVAHLPAGVSILRFGRFDLYRVNPPLVKTVAALPVLLANAKEDWQHFGDTRLRRPEWLVGRDWIRQNGRESFWLWTIARWACIPFSLLGAWVCYRWGTELFGPRAGLAAMVLWCFSPNILAWGASITPDLAATSCGLWACWRFRLWLLKPNWQMAFLAGLAFGLAQMSKMTLVIFFPLFPLIWFVYYGFWQRSAWVNLRRSVGQMIVILALGLYLLNLVYLFDGTAKPLGDYEFYSQILSGNKTPPLSVQESGNRFRGTILGDVPVPLPESYLTGMDLQKLDFEEGRWSYLAGEHRFGGWWYFYLYAMAIKIPVATWFLILLSSGLALAGKVPRFPRVDRLCLFLPALVVFALVSSQTGFTIYLRYALPAFPALFILAGRCAAWRPSWKPMEFLAPILVFAMIAESMWYYPHSLSFFNQLVGGPSQGRHHLNDASIDWGQDAFSLEDWIAQHPEARPLTVAYDCMFDLGVLDIDFPLTPRDPRYASGFSGTGPQPGWHLLGVNFLHHHQHHYDYFEDFDPVDRIGYSILVYHITEQEAKRWLSDHKDEILD